MMLNRLPLLFNYDLNPSIDYWAMGLYYKRDHGFSIFVAITPGTEMIIFFALTVDDFSKRGNLADLNMVNFAAVL
jgi:hypothetical protein